MKRSKKILMLTSETVPFAKTGGLADVVSALSAALVDRGDDVRILMPFYGSIRKTGTRLLKSKVSVQLGNRTYEAGIRSGKIPGTQVKVYFLENEELYGQTGIYTDATHREYPHNDIRFSFLNRICFEVCRTLSWIPDIIHSHDWTAGLAPFFLNTLERKDDFSDTASVFTIHNLGYQGLFPQESLEKTGILLEDFASSGLTHYNSISYLKSGLTHSDMITTVSPTYAGEIQSPRFGCGMDALLRRRSGDLFGILNGVDYTDWNPEDDPLIAPDHYSAEDRSGKSRCKARLQESCGFEIDPKKPLIGMVSRLVEQKGLDVLVGEKGCLEELCGQMEVQVVILGSGEQRYEEPLVDLTEQLPNLAVFTRFDNALAHLIEAGSDFFLMPSQYEPCGLNQMYSLRYGTLPIVRSTGGLADSVTNFNEVTGEGTGFMFYDLTPSALFNTIGWAVWAWYNKKSHLEKMILRGMQQEFSWDSAAEKYREIYQWSQDRRAGEYPRSW